MQYSAPVTENSEYNQAPDVQYSAPTTENSEYNQAQYPVVSQYSYQMQYVPVYVPHPEAKRSNGLSIAGFICGLVGLGMLSIIVSIIALVLSSKGKNLSMSIYGQYNKMAKAGHIMGLIGLISAIVFWVFFITLYTVLYIYFG